MKSMLQQIAKLLFDIGLDSEGIKRAIDAELAVLAEEMRVSEEALFKADEVLNGNGGTGNSDHSGDRSDSSTDTPH